MFLSVVERTLLPGLAGVWRGETTNGGQRNRFFEQLANHRTSPKGAIKPIERASVGDRSPTDPGHIGTGLHNSVTRRDRIPVIELGDQIGRKGVVNASSVTSGWTCMYRRWYAEGDWWTSRGLYGSNWSLQFARREGGSRSEQPTLRITVAVQAMMSVAR